MALRCDPKSTLSGLFAMSSTNLLTDLSSWYSAWRFLIRFAAPLAVGARNPRRWAEMGAPGAAALSHPARSGAKPTLRFQDGA